MVQLRFSSYEWIATAIYYVQGGRNLVLYSYKCVTTESKLFVHGLKNKFKIKNHSNFKKIINEKE
jgi:hypothetical protein